MSNKREKEKHTLRKAHHLDEGGNEDGKDGADVHTLEEENVQFVL